MVNALLLRKELEHITAHPDEWNQSFWIARSTRTACGTSGCLAGNTVLHAGWQVSTTTGKLVDVRDWPSHTAFDTVTRNHVTRCVKSAARHELGLTPAETRVLFDAANQLIDLWVIAELITNGEVEVPQSVPNDRDVPLSEVRETNEAALHDARLAFGE